MRWNLKFDFDSRRFNHDMVLNLRFKVVGANDTKNNVYVETGWNWKKES